ncbi:hypothetical protein cyc_05766 [Cyclospora cayetanensis]|uniref:Uncharacterized protein n=1 Tax=Cyclospora cayetanensis TaxID=88456 RepID=A0A1D3D109_9EIME|nr:hypothetical protein cyc_05766 [Cyclospora cayetanensis]
MKENDRSMKRTPAARKHPPKPQDYASRKTVFLNEMETRYAGGAQKHHKKQADGPKQDEHEYGNVERLNPKQWA